MVQLLKFSTTIQLSKPNSWKVGQKLIQLYDFFTTELVEEMLLNRQDVEMILDDQLILENKMLVQVIDKMLLNKENIDMIIDDQIILEEMLYDLLWSVMWNQQEI